jgi:DNA-binding response OmpR family regulator
VPVILATSHDGTALEVAALQTGADFVSKPLVAAQFDGPRTRAAAHAKQTGRRPQTQVRRHQRGAPTAEHAGATPADRRRRRRIDPHPAPHAGHDGDFHFAKTGEEAHELARRLVPDLSCSTRTCRASTDSTSAVAQGGTGVQHVPIALRDPLLDPRNEMRALDLGAADFIAKPYYPRPCCRRGAQLLELKRRTDAELHAVREHGGAVADARVADIVGAASDAIVTYDGGARGRGSMPRRAACSASSTSGDRLAGASPAGRVRGRHRAAGASAPGPHHAGHDERRELPVEASVSRSAKARSA